MSAPHDPRVALAIAKLDKGDVDGCLRELRWEGAIDHLTAALMRARRYRAAAKLIMMHLALPRARSDMQAAVAKLKGDQRKRAMKAALCLSKSIGPKEDPAGAVVTVATDLFLALGETPRAMELMRRVGNDAAARQLGGGTVPLSIAGTRSMTAPAADLELAEAEAHEGSGRLQAAFQIYMRQRQLPRAAGVARKMKRYETAAQLYSEAGRPYEAGLSYADAKKSREALEQLTRVEPDHKSFRDAAVRVAEYAIDLKEHDFAIESTIAELISVEPETEREISAYCALAEYLRGLDLIDDAKMALRQVISAVPGHKQARRRLAQIDLADEDDASQIRGILKQDVGFNAIDETLEAERLEKTLGALPDLPALPDMPSLPELPQLPDATELGASPMTVAKSGTVGGLSRRMEELGGAEDTVYDPGFGQAALAEAAPGPAANQNKYGKGSPTMHSLGPPSAASGTGEGPSAERPPTAIVESTAVEAITIETGAMLGTRYRIGRQLGEGGMATVFKARDLELEEDVAIKVFKADAQQEVSLARFKQEVSLTRRLSHPNVIRIFDIGQAAGCRFITMEMLSGKDLAHYLGKPIDLTLGIDWLIQMAKGLHAAHKTGVVHRDIKPANVFVCDDGVVKVMDFGIAKNKDNDLTQSGLSWGTPKYMSPEQIRGFSEVTPSADIYALGVIAYEMFAGRVPFKHKEHVPLMMMHVNDKPPAPSKFNPKLPKLLERIILKMLGKNAESRPPDCRSVVGALRKFEKTLAAA